VLTSSILKGNKMAHFRAKHAQYANVTLSKREACFSKDLHKAIRMAERETQIEGPHAPEEEESLLESKSKPRSLRHSL
jgi:hypothetical protein